MTVPLLPPELTAALADRYRIERELGAGGMATVYLAHDVRHDRKVALKVLRQDVARTLGAERFLREIQLAAKLSHPHILPLFDSGAAGSDLYYVMPNVEGHSLRDRMEQVGKLSVEESVRVASEVAGALDYAHRHGVVHRDIKPENILLQDGHALVADFGIGKALSAVEGEAFTNTGVSIGTPAYMSPEQAAGETVDGRSDLYSLGCVLYEMLTGEQPFTGPTVQAVIAKRFVQTPADVTALREGVTRPVARAVHKALARTPIDRYETGALLAAALAETESVTLLPAAPEKSLAVLPFVNLSSDPENEFFADGITEEILNALASIPGLRVAGRTSSFSFKGKNQELRTIAEKLNVRTVLEGSVRRAGQRVRVTAQLSDATDGYRLWSERYDREITDVFAVQDEIATAIAEKMKATLEQGSAGSQAQRATASIEAYAAYLKGRALLYRRGNSVQLGLAQMERALSLDPEYGLAWAGIADTYSLLGYYGVLPPEAARAKADEASANAIRFAPDVAEAHTARALLLLLYEWDWAGAERSFLRAIALNPGYVQAGAWYHTFYQGFACGRFDEAVAGLRALQSSDQLSSYLAAIISVTYATGLRDPEAVRWAELAMSLEPDAFLSIWARQLALLSIGEWTRGFAAADAALSASGRMALPLCNLGLALVEAGDVPAARSIYDELRSRTVREYVPPTLLAQLAAALGDREAAIAAMQEAVRRHDPQFVIFARGWTGAQHLRALPEHRRLLVEIGLPGLE